MVPSYSTLLSNSRPVVSNCLMCHRASWHRGSKNELTLLSYLVINKESSQLGASGTKKELKKNITTFIMFSNLLIRKLPRYGCFGDDCPFIIAIKMSYFHHHYIVTTMVVKLIMK